MSQNSKKPMIQEMLLEFIQTEEGRLLLRESQNKDEVLVSIDFSDKVKDMLGDDVRYIGEHMIHAAMAAVMHKQMERFQAHVYDEEPKRYS